MRKPLVLFLLLMLPVSMSAVEWDSGVFIGYRESTTTFNPLTLEAFGRFGNVFLSVRNQNDDYTSRYDMSAGYDLRTKKLEHVFSIHTAWMTEEGGWTDFSYILGIGKRWEWFSLDCILGLGGAFAWSVYGPDLTWAVSPVLGLDTGFHAGIVDLYLYAALFHPEERDFHYTPVAGGRVEVRLGYSSVIFDCYAKAAEYIIDPWLTLNAYAFRIGYCYKGEI